MNSRTRIFLAVISLLTCVFAFDARAATATEVTAMYFGDWVVPNNDSSHEVTVETDGSYSSSPDLIMLSPPTPGVFDISGLEPNTTVNSITVTLVTPMTHPGSESFVMDDFDTEASSSTIDGTGTLRVTVGGTASTSGSSELYDDGTYQGDLELTFELNL